LRDFLRKKLPDYMVPSVFVPLREIPRTFNRKIDRGMLPRPESQAPMVVRTIIEPRTETEAALVQIWHDILHVTSISVEDDFFELGGDSFLIQRVVGQIQDRFNVIMPIRAVFLKPTIANLAAHIDHFKRLGASEEERLLEVVSKLTEAQVDSFLNEVLRQPEWESRQSLGAGVVGGMDGKG
jgi:acyl carrier protein